MVTEGEQEMIDLHTHFAISKPITMSHKEFSKAVIKALELSGDFEITNPNYEENLNNLEDKYRYKLDLIDEGWLTYITKKLDGKDFKNLYLP
jgi:PHP family Zn ribbon phosphoesterase